MEESALSFFGLFKISVRVEPFASTKSCQIEYRKKMLSVLVEIGVVTDHEPSALFTVQFDTCIFLAQSFIK